MAGIETRERKAYAHSLNKLAGQLVFTPKYPDTRPPTTALITSEGSLSLKEIKTHTYFIQRSRPGRWPHDPRIAEESAQATQGYLGLGHILVLLAHNEPLPETLNMDEPTLRRYIHSGLGSHIELAQRRYAEILTTDTPSLPYEARDQEQKIKHWTKVRKKLLQEPGAFSVFRRR